MSSNKKSYFNAKKVDSNYIKKNGKKNKLPSKKIISFVLALTLIGSSGATLAKLVREKQEEFNISNITFDKANKIQNDDVYYENLYKIYRKSLGGDEFVNELSRVYDTATTYVSELYDKLELENSLQCYYLFNYLDDNGYLSKDNNEINRQLYEDKDSYYLDLYLDDLEGADVLYKKSVCRQEADYFSKTTNKYGIKTYPVSCFLGDKNKEYNIKSPNHSVVVSEDLGVIELDTLNNLIYDKPSNNYVDSDPNICFSYDTNNFTYQMTDSSKEKNVICSKLSDDEIEKVKEDILNDKESLTEDEIKKQEKIVKLKISSHENDIEDFKEKYNSNVLEKLPKIKR